MRPETRKKVREQLFSALALGYGVPAVGDKSPRIEAFSAEPAVAQRMVDAVQLNSNFLQRINMLGVVEKTGEAVMNLLTGPLARRTDTDTADRAPQNAHDTTTNPYSCVKVESDIFIPYSLLDAWAKFPDLAQRIRRMVSNQISLDIITAGWYGTSVAAAATDFAANQNLQDLNTGWLQKARDYNSSAQVMSEGGTAGQIRIGADGDYANLDAAVYDCLQLIDERFTDAGDLVALVGRELMATEKGRLYAAQGDTPTEKEKIELQQVTATYGGLPTYVLPKFPLRGCVVTSFNNLSYYFQDSSVRKAIQDNPKRDRIEEFTSINQDFVIEERDKFAAFEPAHVKIPDGAGGWM